MKRNFNRLVSLTSTLAFVTTVIGCSTPNSDITLKQLQNSNDVVLAQQAKEIQTFNSQFDKSGISKKTLNIKLKKRISDAEAQRVAEKYGMTVKRYVKAINLLTLESGESFKNDTATKLNSETSLVSHVYPSIKVQVDPLKVSNSSEAMIETTDSLKAINDPLFADQYGLKLMDMEEAWKINPGDANIKIAMIDTGIDLNHPDLKDKLVAGKNINDSTKQPMDDNGHGTHTAGIAAAAFNNNEGGAGVGGKCSIMPVKVLNNGGGTDDTIAEGIVWAADNGANVMSMSIGMYRSSKPIEDALKYALDKNVTLVASAGNNNAEYDVHLPSTYPGVIEVASTDAKDQKSSFSNFGKRISVAAPGSDIVSTLPTYTVGSKPKSYGKLSGTSMACPHVAGLAALILSQKPGLKPAEVRKIIESTAVDLGDKGWDKYYGNGRVDALAALKSIQ